MPASLEPTTIPMVKARLASPVDAGAWRAFVERYRSFIDERCLRAGLQPADVEKIRLRVLAGLAAAMPRFDHDPARRFRGYLNAVIRNAVRSYWRELARRPGVAGLGGTRAADEAERIGVAAKLDGLAEELDERISADLSALWFAMTQVSAQVSLDTWRVFWRTAFEGIPAVTVAHELGKSVAAVHTAKSRVVKLLRAEMRAAPDTD